MAEGGSSVDCGTGAILTLGTSGDWDALEIVSIDWSGISRPSVSTSHMGTAKAGASEFGGGSFIPGDIVDPGEVTIVFHCDPDLTPPSNTAIETFQIEFPKYSTDTAGAKWVVDGAFMTNMDIGIPLEDVMTCTCTWKLSADTNITVSVAVA